VSSRLYVARSGQVAARRLGDEMMIMSPSDSMLYTLNDAAAMIWESADGKTPLDEIVAHGICSKYEVAPEEALKDSKELAEQLARQGVLVISDKPIAAASAAAGSSR
jgi:hypothetical protein